MMASGVSALGWRARPVATVQPSQRADEEAETQKGELIPPRSHSYEVAQAGRHLHSLALPQLLPHFQRRGTEEKCSEGHFYQ